jgi:hypothetical protein
MPSLMAPLMPPRQCQLVNAINAIINAITAVSVNVINGAINAITALSVNVIINGAMNAITAVSVRQCQFV